jgi:hypothetical protein
MFCKIIFDFAEHHISWQQKRKQPRKQQKKLLRKRLQRKEKRSNPLAPR